MTDNTAADLKETLFEIMDRDGGLAGHRFRSFCGALAERRITAFRDKFTSQYLASLKFQANTIIDVGVNNGTPELYSAFKGRKFILIEPMKECLVNCQAAYPDLDADSYEVAAGARNGTATINVMPVSGHNSLLNRSWLAAAGTRTIQVRRLDNLIEEKGYEGPFGLKIDTEGYELEVMAGATGIVCNLEFILAEISIKRLFEGGYRFSDAVRVMADAGFELFDVLNPKGGPPNAYDCLFLRADDPRFEMKSGV